MKNKLVLDTLIQEAKAFCEAESKIKNPRLFDVANEKAVGQYIETKFKEHLGTRYKGEMANIENDLDVQIKVLSTKQLQFFSPLMKKLQHI